MSCCGADSSCRAVPSVRRTKVGLTNPNRHRALRPHHEILAPPSLLRRECLHTTTQSTGPRTAHVWPHAHGRIVHARHAPRLVLGSSSCERGAPAPTRLCPICCSRSLRRPRARLPALSLLAPPAGRPTSFAGTEAARYGREPRAAHAIPKRAILFFRRSSSSGSGAAAGSVLPKRSARFFIFSSSGPD